MNTHACAWTVMVVTATDYDNILNYLRHGRYPAAFKKNDKRNLRRIIWRTQHAISAEAT